MMESKPLLAKYTEFPAVADEPAPKEGTIFTSFLGLMSTMAGACILTLPSTMSAATVWPASLLLLALAGLAYAGCFCLCVACDGSGGAESFESLIQRLRHPVQLWLVRTLLMMLLFGAIIMYIVIAIDMLSPFVPLSRFVLGGLFAAVCLPLCLPDTVTALRYTNSVVVACVLYIVVVLTWQATTQPWPEPKPSNSSIFGGFAYTVPIQALSYCMHLNVPQVYNELGHKQSMPTVLVLVLGGGFGLYLTSAIAGYVCFNGTPPGDILNGFANDNASINGVRLALGLCMVFKTPVTYQPLRDVLESLVHDYQVPKMPFRVAVTSVFLITSWILAVTAKDVSYVMDWVGATAGIMLSFAFPGLFLWELLDNDDHHTFSSAQVLRYRTLAAFMMATGVTLSIISIAKIIWFD
ncbi:unnamed protein product [Aphanomyces euteiches]|nr:hypothetical protein AeRB84_005911 [Aphanomyces euteiches]